MGKSVKDLVINILADDSGASKTFDKVGDKAGGMNKKLEVGVAAVGAAALAGAGLAVHAGMKIDEAYDTIQQGTGATGAALDGLQNSFSNVAKKVPNDMGEIGAAVADLNTRTGMTGEHLETVAAQLLRVSGFSGQTAVDIGELTGATNMFNVPAEDMSSTLDQLYGISMDTGLSVNDLAVSLNKGGVALKSVGFSIGDAAMMLGTLDKAGLDSDKMVAGMNRSLATMAKTGEPLPQTFKRVTDEIGVFVEKGDQAAAYDLASKLFGAKGASQFVEALQSGALNIDALKGSAAGAEASIMDMAESTDDFPEKMKVLQNNADLALGKIGMTLIPLITEGIEKLIPIVDWAADNTDLLMGIAVAIGAGAIALKGWLILQSISGALATFRAAQAAGTAITWASTTATLANNLAWLASPVTWIVAGIVAAIAGLVLAAVWLVDNWDGVAEWFGELWTNLGHGVETFFGWIGDTITAWNPLGFFADAWNGVTNFFGDFWNGLVGGAVNAGLWLGSEINKIVGFFTSIPDRIGDAWNGLIGLIRDVMRNVMSFTIDVWNNTLGSLNFNLPWFLGGGNISFPKLHIPALAEGGIVTGPTLALIGEAGPEAVVPLSRGSQYGVGAGQMIEITNVTQLDGRELSRSVRRVNAQQAW